MHTSENINELITALSKAQAEICGASKDSVNPHFKSKFASLASVWDACRLPLTKNGLAIVQTTDISADGKYVLVTTLAHSSGQWMRSLTPILMSKQDAQGLGSGLSYSRRYALSSIVGVCPEDDDGNEACKPADVKQPYITPKQEPKPKVITPLQVEQINNLIEHFPPVQEKFKATLTDKGMKHMGEIPLDKFDAIFNWLQGLVNEQMGAS